MKDLQLHYFLGSLLYLTTRSRRTVCRQQCCSFLLQANETALGCKRIFRISEVQFNWKKRRTVEHNADWGGDCNDYKSTTGYLFQIGGTAVTCIIVKRSTGSSLDARTYLRLTGHIHGDTPTSQQYQWQRTLNDHFIR